MRENNKQRIDNSINKNLNKTIKNITVLCYFVLTSASLTSASTHASTIYIDPGQESFDEMKWKFSNRDRINFLFDIIDNDPKDNYLYFNELYLFQKATEPMQELQLTPDIYRQLCKLFNANPNTGLTKEEFNSSYYLHSNALGTDLDRDFSIILDKYITYHTNQQNKYPPNKYPPNSY